MSLILRKLRASDIENYYMLVGDEAVMAFITGSSYSYEEAEHELGKLVEKYAKDPVFGVWAAESDKLGFIGTGLLLKEGVATANIGYRVMKKYWGRGFGKKIAEMLIEKAKQNAIQTLTAEAEMENEASLNILSELGFEAIEIRKNELENEIGLFKLNI